MFIRRTILLAAFVSLAPALRHAQAEMAADTDRDEEQGWQPPTRGRLGSKFGGRFDDPSNARSHAPPPRLEEQPPPPDRGRWIWHSGHWTRTGEHWHWTNGRWDK